MADDALEQVLLELGLDLSPVQKAGGVIAATMGDLNRLTEQYQSKTVSAGQAALSKTQEYAQAAVAAAKQAIAAEQQKQATLASETAELEKQIATQKLVSEQAAAGIAVEEKKLLLLQQQSEQLRLQQLENRKSNEARGEGHGFGTQLGSALLGRGSVTSVFAGALGGIVGGELAVQAIEQIVEKLKEVTKEAGSINLLQDSFEKLAKGAGRDAGQMMAELQEKTEGLVDRYHLLQAGNQILKSSLVDPDKAMRGLAAAIKLAESNGQSAERAMNGFNRAMLSGRGLALAYAVGLSPAESRVINLAQGIGAANRQSIQLNSTFDLLIKKAAALGEVPKTFEQMEKHLHNSVKNLTLAFGQGINQSAGTQMFLDLINNGSKSLDSLYAKIVEVGRRAGDVFAVLGVSARESFGVFKEILSIIGNLASTFSSFLFVQADPIEHLSESGRKAVDAFAAMHPVLASVVAEIIHLGTEIKIILAYIDSLSEKLHSIVDSDTRRKVAQIGLTIGAQAGGEIGGKFGTVGRIVGSGVGAFVGGTAGEAVGIAGPSVAARSKPTPSLEEKIAQYQADEKNKLEQFAKDYTQFQDNLSKTIQGIAKNGLPDQNNPGAERKLAQEIMQSKLAAAKEELSERKALIAEQKALDDEAYRSSEEDLSSHLAKQLGIARLNREAQKEEANQTLAAQLEQERTTYQTRLGQVGITPTLKKSIDEEHAESIKRIWLNNITAINKADSAYEQQRVALFKQGEEDIRQGAVKDIQDRLSSQKEAIEAQQKELEQQFGEQQIDPNTYYQKRLQLIMQTAQAEIAASDLVFQHQQQNDKTQAENDATRRKAAQQAAEQVKSLTQEHAKNVFDYIQQSTSAQQSLYGVQITGAQQTGNVPLASQLTQASIASLQVQKDQLIGMLPIMAQQPKLWYQTMQAIEEATAKQREYFEQLRQMSDLAKPAGTTLGAVTSAAGSIAGTRYAQNLLQSLGAGARNLASSGGNLGIELAGKQRAVGYDKEGNPISTTTQIKDPFQRFSTQLTAAAQAVEGFASSIMNAKNAVSGGIGGAVGGAGLGNTLSQARLVSGPLGAIGGMALGATLGIITGSKQQALKNQLDQLNQSFKNIMYQFNENTNNLQSTIQQLEGLIAQAQTMQAQSKKGSSAFQQQIDQYIDQLKQLQAQQIQLMRQLQMQVAVTSVVPGAQQYLSDLQAILQQYQQFAGAAQTTNQLAEATQYLTQSLQAYEQNLEQQLLQDNQQAINDALQLNDLLFQRNEMILEYNQQVSSVLSAGVLTRQLTRAQTAGSQIYQIQQQYNQQMAQINEQIAADQYKVAAEQQVFALATTRIGLETQLLALQNEQTNFDMQRIAALSSLVTQLSTGNLNAGALGALLAALPPVSVNGQTQDVNSLEQQFAAAYQNRASMGYAAFRAQNL